MPDQHTAATEHALITKIAEPLSQLPDDPLDLGSPDFPIDLRGYDRFAVDVYVDRTSQLISELQATSSPEAAVRRALERVGEEISGILQQAHDTANEITSRSRSEAEERLEAARQEATQISAAAEVRVKDLDSETERIWAERHSIVTDARALAGRLTDLAESALERFPAASPPADAAVTETITAAPVPAPFDGAVDDATPGEVDGSEGPDRLSDQDPTAEQPLADEQTAEEAPDEGDA